MPRYLDLDEAKKNPDWQVVFAGGLNAGDASAILWESPFESAYGLWQLKTKRKPRPEQTDAMLHGIATEPLVYDWYKKWSGTEGRSQVWAIHDECEFIRGLGDFWNAETRHGAEFKSPSREDTEDHFYAQTEHKVPWHYLLQCWHLMEVYDALTWDFVSWRSESDYAVVPVDRNTEYWLTTMLPAYMKFWEHVQANEWPEPQGKVFEESEEWAMHARRLLTGKSMIIEGKDYQKRAEAGIKRMATAKTTVGAGIKATWSIYKPRYEAKISAASPEALERIMTALKPLEGRQGVSKISSSLIPANLVMRIGRTNKEPE